MASPLIPSNVATIMQTLIDNGYQAFIVGGFCRDLKLGRMPHDADVFTNALGPQILKVFPNGKVIGGEERQAKILTVIVDGVEVSTFRRNGDRTETGKNLHQHQSTCDFDVNSIAMSIDGEIHDPNNGLIALEMYEFGFVGQPQDRIKEDPLRLLRAVRFMASHKLSFKHIGALKEYGHFLNNLPQERIREEFLKIIQYDNGLELLIYHGLIKYILPKFLENVGVNGGEHHNETVDQHLLYAFNIARSITSNRMLWLAALLHDIAKGETFSCTKVEAVKMNEKVTLIKDVHFFAHEDVGARYTKEWMTQLKFPQKDINFVVCLIRNHMWQYDETYYKRAFIRVFKDFDDNNVHITDFVALKYCDHQANLAHNRVKYADFVRKTPLIKKYYELKFTKEPFKVSEMAISGKDLMDMGMKQGPGVGSLLQEAFNEIMDGNLANERPTLMLWARVRVNQFMLGAK